MTGNVMLDFALVGLGIAAVFGLRWLISDAEHKRRSVIAFDGQPRAAPAVTSPEPRAKQGFRSWNDRVPLEPLKQWVVDGLIAEESPDPGLVLAPGRPSATVLELTSPELAVIAEIVEPDQLFGWAAPLPNATERAATTRRLIARGVLRLRADRLELTPEQLPLLGVALHAQHALSVGFFDGVETKTTTRLHVPGYAVLLERVLGETPDSDDEHAMDPPDSFRRFTATTLEATIEPILAGLPHGSRLGAKTEPPVRVSHETLYAAYAAQVEGDASTAGLTVWPGAPVDYLEACHRVSTTSVHITDERPREDGRVRMYSHSVIDADDLGLWLTLRLGDEHEVQRLTHADLVERIRTLVSS